MISLSTDSGLGLVEIDRQADEVRTVEFPVDRERAVTTELVDERSIHAPPRQDADTVGTVKAI
jgi:hypothetical protein